MMMYHAQLPCEDPVSFWSEACGGECLSGRSWAQICGYTRDIYT
jgi:hypothetical protein